ncbi:MAG: guanylate kinase [Patescibacteria group bacterium]
MSPVFVITGPSAAGKTAVISALLKLFPEAGRMINTTTRPQRPGEVHGKDYWFMTRQEFENAVKNDEFIEWVETYGNLYGSSRAHLKDSRAKYPLVFMSLDMRGAHTYFEKVPDIQVIFIKPGNIEDLRRRLAERRSSTSPEELDRRMKEIRHEIDTAHEFSTVILNRDGKLDEAVGEAVLIVRETLAKRA